MSEPRSPLQSAWHTLLSILAIVVVAWLILLILLKIWLFVLIVAAFLLGGYIAFVLIKSRRDRW
jgi:hypothetical protein